MLALPKQDVFYSIKISFVIIVTFQHHSDVHIYSKNWHSIVGQRFLPLGDNIGTIYTLTIIDKELN